VRRRTGSRSAVLTAAVLLALASGGCGGARDRVRPLPAGTVVTVHNHREVVVRADGVIPRFLGGRDAALCLEAPAGTDVSQWRASLGFRGTGARGRSAESRQPTARSGRILCFEPPWPEGLDAPADLELCGSVTDLYDGAVFELPCERLRFEPDTGARSTWMQKVNTAVSTRHQGPVETLAERLTALGRAARSQGFPALDLRARLIAVHYLLHEGDTSDVRRADRLLRSLPGWLDEPAATALAADATYLRGVLRLRLDRLEDAWKSFLEAEALYRRVLDRKRLAAVRGQAEVLGRVGASREGLYRLEAALASCGDLAPCSPVQQLDARGLHAWLTLIDSDASPEELNAAEENLESLQGEPALEPQERANHLINLALLRARQGREPTATLAEAQHLVTPADGSRRADLLRGWSGMAEALYQLSRSDADLGSAESECRELVDDGTSDRLRAWAYSCLGRIHRRRGHPSLALRSFRSALALHEDATPERLGRLLPLGPGQRADDYYRAARAALDLGDTAGAWDLLTALDHLPPGGSGVTADSPTGRPPSDVEYRAFALDDEILLLHRDGNDRVTLVRRSTLARGDLRERTDAVDRALAERRLSDAAWRELLRPLADALAPPPDAPPRSVTSYALHGLLQRVPLAALPVSGGTSPENRSSRWLADRTTVAVRPAGSGALAAAGSRRATDPLIVIDPSENLGARRELTSFYSQRFPASRLLVGREATEAAFRRALATASWLHADTHGTYDPAFPERSSLELADGAVTLRQLAQLPLSLSFANLSGCRTGAWPVTADSGRYGLGGLLARRGVPWVIASRSDLLNDLAVDFNSAFYDALKTGAPVPEAYDRALARVRERFPAVAWASIFLIRGAGAPEPSAGSARTAGQTGPPPTPTSVKTLSMRPAGGGNTNKLTPASR
jgi:CHAT domain-containing protein